MTDPDVELRFNVPTWVAQVLDAHVSAKRLPRNKVCQSILAGWARDQMHLATIVGRVTRGNGIEAPSEWGGVEE